MIGGVRMVDVSEKHPSKREAVASSEVILGRDIIALIKRNRLPKGDVLTTAKIAGIQAAKKTPELIPMCHPVQLAHIEINFTIKSDRIIIESNVKAQDVTGVEMEAMTASSICALTIYDMCKMLKKDITIENVRLIKKSGGKSGIWMAAAKS